ncbi:hypothetical protein [Novosphingobium sp.]|uniref:hypothetical protein n=1 Tax=Novosphingobium sp. TaxID=1874826 RepID=UPI0035B03D91
MRKIVIALAATTTLLSGAAVEAKPKLTPEQQLAKMLEGREAGEPVSCISLQDTRDMTVLDKTAIVYRTGSVIWVNRPTNAEHLDSDDIMVTHPTGSQFCKLDIVNTVDRSGHFTTGFITLGDFVPYRKVDKPN